MAAGADQWDCEGCRARGTSFCDRDRKLPGSLGPAPGPRWRPPAHGGSFPAEVLRDLGAPADGLDTCPLPMVPKWWPELARLTRLYRDGHLLVGGGAMAQPAAWLAAVQFASQCSEHYQAQRLRGGGQGGDP